MTTTDRDEQLLLEAFPFLERAPGEARRLLRESSTRVSLPAGTVICREGNQCANMALLLSGSVRVYKIGESGREITLYRLGPGQSCILTASCILNDIEFPAHAVVETDTEALVVPAPVFQDWTSRYDVWRKYVFALASQRLANVIMLIEEVAFGRMDKRLADYLSEAAAAAEEDPPVLRTTHEAIAADLGSSREVVSRLLKDLEVGGAIKLARGTITVLHPPGVTPPN